MTKLLRALAPFLALCGTAAAATVTGVVLAPDGTPDAHARVTASSGGRSTTVATTRDGSFRIVLPGTAPVDLRVESAGCVPAERTLESDDTAGVEIALSSAAVADAITVTATRTPRAVAGTAAPTTIVPRTELEASPAPVLDDALRIVPGFALFRRTGSRTSNPTAQGVSLRGLGASGTSRALVLADDVPMNDPFGGWIYWGRIPAIALDRVEIVEGGGSDVWGSGALGGVVRLLRDDAAPAAAVEAWGGSQSTSATAGHGAFAAGPVTLSADGEIFSTGGYVPVAPEERGAVDVEASSRHRAFDAAASVDVGGSAAVFLRGSRYTEERGNGTPIQKNDTSLTEWSGGLDGAAAGGALALRGYRSDETFHQTFSAIAPDRDSETLVSAQRVPSSASGGSAQWARALGTIHEIAVGADYREVEGTSEDTVYLPSGPSLRPSGGRQRNLAGWIEDVANLSAGLTLSGSVRYDAWRNLDGRTFEAGAPVALADRSADAWSPRIAAVWQAAPALAWTASAYRAFRAPTLNELYRPFRLGNVQTLANAELAPEKLSGVETGVRYQPADGRFFARADFFWIDVGDAVGNVTLSSTPTLITRERENIGRIRDRGIAIAVDARLSPEWSATAGYLLADARVASSPQSPALVGNRVPQVPRDQATAQVRYARPALATVALQARWSGPQFDDDANAFPLGSFFTLDAWISRGLPGGLEVFAAGENLTDRRNEAARTPVTTLAQPRTFRAGLRWRL